MRTLGYYLIAMVFFAAATVCELMLIGEALYWVFAIVSIVAFTLALLSSTRRSRPKKTGFRAKHLYIRIKSKLQSWRDLYIVPTPTVVSKLCVNY